MTVLKVRQSDRYGLTVLDSTDGKMLRIHRQKRGREPYREVDIPLDIIPDLVEDLLDYLYPSLDGAEIKKAPPDPWDGLKVRFRNSPKCLRTLHREEGKSRPPKWFARCALDSGDHQARDPKRKTNTGCLEAEVRRLYENLDGSSL